MRSKVRFALGGSLVLTVLWLFVFGPADVVDLPAWTNVPGVDVPIIGDTDQIDCRLTVADDRGNVKIKLVDGDQSTYESYVNVYNNNRLLDSEEITRVADDTMLVPSDPTKSQQFYSIAIRPVRSERVYCASINITR